jgi:hypothetical protein
MDILYAVYNYRQELRVILLKYGSSDGGWGLSGHRVSGLWCLLLPVMFNFLLCWLVPPVMIPIDIIFSSRLFLVRMELKEITGRMRYL